MSEDDFVNTLDELAELKVTVPALLETGAGIVGSPEVGEDEGGEGGY